MELMEKIIALCKRRGFIFPGSEIYGGVSSLYDWGYYGLLLKNNIKKLWWEENVSQREDMVGLEAAILMHPKTWIASGHLSSFSDPLIECKSCHQRFRGDYLFEGKYGEIKTINGRPLCPLCQGELTEERKFNLMFKTHIGPVEDTASVIYLRPETAQGIFVNFKTVLNSYRKKIPFGIAQIGKAFRNEITPGNFIFRMREFEQMEIEFFVEPGRDSFWLDYWRKERMGWYQKYGLKSVHLRFRKHSKKELAHYSKETYDIEYLFPWGWGELEGIANRGNFDLSTHQKHSGKDLSYFDESQKKSYLPFVIEPSAGVERIALAFLLEAYSEEKKRVILKFHPQLAPIKIAVFPLLANQEKLIRKAREIYRELKKRYPTEFDERGNIGKRYFAQDEIGTPWCVTIDYETLKNQTVTVRERDTMKQVRIKDDLLISYFQKMLGEKE